MLECFLNCYWQLVLELQEEEPYVSSYLLFGFVLKMELVYEIPQNFLGLGLVRDCHSRAGKNLYHGKNLFLGKNLFGGVGVTMSEEEHYDNFDVENEMVELFASVRQQFESGANYFAAGQAGRHQRSPHDGGVR